jgi:hypothetical protein
MALLPRKPGKLSPKISDIVADEKAAMAKRKAMFDAMLLDALSG